MKEILKWVGVVAIVFVLVFIMAKMLDRVHASTSLGLADSYAVLASTYTDTSAGTTIAGSVGFTTPPATAPLGIHPNYGSGAPYVTAGIDQGAALAVLNSLPCDFSFGSATDLSLLVQPLVPGVYCVTGAQSVGTGGITLLSGQYVFRSIGALNTVVNSVVSGGDACDIFWTPIATTLGANSTFKGTVIDNAGITVGAAVSWVGRALSFGGTVTTDADNILVPSCAPPIVTPLVVTPSSGGSTGTSGSCYYGYDFTNRKCNLAPVPVTPVTECLSSPAAYAKCYPSKNGKE